MRFSAVLTVALMTLPTIFATSLTRRTPLQVLDAAPGGDIEPLSGSMHLLLDTYPAASTVHYRRGPKPTSKATASTRSHTLGAQTQSPYILHPVTQQPVVDWDSTNPTNPQYFTYTVGGQRVPHPDRDALRNPTQMEDRKVYYKDGLGRYWLHPVDNWKWYAQTSGTTARRQ